ncbi:MAG: hypothetical protein RDU25_05430 [Patescibacteria group bacterium]|nr:hypothetical protein [Patescibacteria group bacterium]
MSRRTFEHDGLIWTVGWDSPLQSFYAQVEGKLRDVAQQKKLQPFRQLGYGSLPEERLDTVEDLVDLLLDKADVEIPEDIQIALCDDQRAASPPTPLQLAFQRIFAS